MKQIKFRTHKDSRRAGSYDVIPGLTGDMNFSKHPAGVIPEELHLHKSQTDYFVVVEGEVLFCLEDAKGHLEQVVVSADDDMTIEIRPGIWHGYTALVPSTMLFYITHKFDTADEFRKKCDPAIWKVKLIR